MNSEPAFSMNNRKLVLARSKRGENPADAEWIENLDDDLVSLCGIPYRFIVVGTIKWA